MNKKLLYMVVVVILSTLLVSGCGKISFFSSGDSADNLSCFLRALVAHNLKNAQNYLTAEAKENLIIKLPENPVLDEYQLASYKQSDNVIYYEFMLSQVNTKRPYHKIIDSLAVMDSKKASKIAKIKELRYVEVYPDHDKMMWSSKNAQEPTVLFTLKQIPKQYNSVEAGDGNQLLVGRSGFGEVRISFDKKRVAFATYGDNGFIGFYDFQDGKVHPLNVFNQGRIKNIYWSKDSRYIAYTIITPVGSCMTQIYDSKHGNIEEVKLPSDITYPEYSIELTGWSSENIFQVEVKDEGVAKKINKKILGTWTYDVGKQKMQKSYK